MPEPRYVLVDNSKEGSIKNGNCGYYAYALGLMSYLCKGHKTELAKEIWQRLDLDEKDRSSLNSIIKEKNGFMSLKNQRTMMRLLGPVLREKNIDNIINIFSSKDCKGSPYHSPLIWKIKKMIAGQLLRPQRWLLGEFSDPDGIFSGTELLRASGIYDQVEKYAKKCQAEVAKLDRQLLRNKADPNYMTQQFIISYKETTAEYTRLWSLIQEKQASEDDKEKAQRYYDFIERNRITYTRVTQANKGVIVAGSEPEKVAWSRLKEDALAEVEDLVNEAYESLVKSPEFQWWFRAQFAHDGVWASDIELNGCLHPFVQGEHHIPFSYVAGDGESTSYLLHDDGILLSRRSKFQRLKSGHTPSHHWMTLVPNKQFLLEPLQEGELGDFNKIYQALVAGQNKMFRTNKGERVDVNKINEYVLKYPTSKSACALWLLKKHKVAGLDHSNLGLVADIYDATRSKYGRSRKAADWANPQSSTTFFDYIKKQEKRVFSSRSVAIYKSLEP
ncbi:hypothetical protein ACR9PT_05680 [Piscirickettsia salmonis]|uniref:hypothetical protein n=1 Tax=Piscirickettsia salmonis TaxID=1238 RepID=UPI003EBDE62E